MRIKDYFRGPNNELDRSRTLRAELDAVTERLGQQVSSVDRLLSTPPEERFLIEESIFPKTTRRSPHHPASRRQARKDIRP